MDNEECRKVLLSRVRKVTPWNAEAIVRHIFDVLTLDKIRAYVDESDAGIHTLIDEMEKSMKARARSPGREFPPPSWKSQGQSSKTSEAIQAPSAGEIGNSQLPGSSSVQDDGMQDFLDSSWNSQGQSRKTSEGIQAPPAGEIGNSQLPGSSSVPDDGMHDFPGPSWNSQGQSSSTSLGFQSVPTGQIVTSQIPEDKSIGLNEHSQSSIVSGWSNAAGCLPSSSRPWPDTCRFYISRRGHCNKGLSCDFSHGFGPSGKLEVEIRQLLWRIPGGAVFVADLPRIYLEWYKKYLPAGPSCNPRGLPSLLRSLHTICWVSNRYECHFLVLVEHYQSFIGYTGYSEVLQDEGSNQIYIRFSAESRSICTEEKVYLYFSQYGPVLSVNIPHQSSYGFVRFQYPGTVRLLLSEWNPQVPHFIFEAAVIVRRCIPKREAKLKNTARKHGLENRSAPRIVTDKSTGTSAPEIAPPPTHSQPSHPQMEIDPLEGGAATGSPDADSADHNQPSHSQVEVGPPEGAQVPDGLDINPVEDGLVPDDLEINPVEDGQVPVGLDEDPEDEQLDDEIIAGLPDVSCFYKQT